MFVNTIWKTFNVNGTRRTCVNFVGVPNAGGVRECRAIARGGTHPSRPRPPSARAPRREEDIGRPPARRAPRAPSPAAGVCPPSARCACDDDTTTGQKRNRARARGAEGQKANRSAKWTAARRALSVMRRIQCGIFMPIFCILRGRATWTKVGGPFRCEQSALSAARTRPGGGPPRLTRARSPRREVAREARDPRREAAVASSSVGRRVSLQFRFFDLVPFRYC